MARYFAEIDQSDTVLRVLVAEPDYINSGKVGNPSNWIEGFMDEDGVTNPKKLYPSIGHKYNYDLGIFYFSQPYPSWTLNDTTCMWEAPVPYPDDEEAYTWNEANQSWDLHTD